MKHILPKLIILTLLVSAYSCGRSDKSDSVTYDVTADITEVAAQPADNSANKIVSTPEVAPEPDNHAADSDSEPYRLGREHGASLHSGCNTEEQISDELLDINARVHIIRSRIGEDAARDYLAGIRDYLKESSDTLATVLF